MAVVIKSNKFVGGAPSANTGGNTSTNPNVTFDKDQDYGRILDFVNTESAGNREKKRKLLYDAAVGMAQSKHPDEYTDTDKFVNAINEELNNIQYSRGVNPDTEYYTGDEIRNNTIGGGGFLANAGR